MKMLFLQTQRIVSARSERVDRCLEPLVLCFARLPRRFEVRSLNPTSGISW